VALDSIGLQTVLANLLLQLTAVSCECVAARDRGRVLQQLKTRMGLLSDFDSGPDGYVVSRFSFC